jgi:hypothetical protein
LNPRFLSLATILSKRAIFSFFVGIKTRFFFYTRWRTIEEVCSSVKYDPTSTTMVSQTSYYFFSTVRASTIEMANTIEECM